MVYILLKVSDAHRCYLFVLSFLTFFYFSLPNTFAFYFSFSSHLKDLHAGKIHRYNLVDSPLCEKGTLVSEELVKKTVDQLIYGRDGEVKFLTCQSQACVLQKNG